MLILRCVFWLMVVYAAILSHGTFRFDEPGAAAVSVARADAKAVIETASVGATAYCARHAGTCLDEAARLTGLFAAVDGQSDEARPTFAENVLVHATAPRRGRRDAKLTRTP